jgi:hypothetical protein
MPRPADAAAHRMRCGFRLGGGLRHPRFLTWSQRQVEEENMLELNGITKSYGVQRVLDDVSFRVPSGA